MLLAVAFVCLLTYSTHTSVMRARIDKAMHDRQMKIQLRLDRADKFSKDGLSICPVDGMKFLDKSGNQIDSAMLLGGGVCATGCLSDVGTTACFVGLRSFYVDTSTVGSHDKDHSRAWGVLSAITSNLPTRDPGWKVYIVTETLTRPRVIDGVTIVRPSGFATATLAHDCGAVLHFTCVRTPDSDNMYEVLVDSVIRSAPDNWSISYGSGFWR